MNITATSGYVPPFQGTHGPTAGTTATTGSTPASGGPASTQATLQALLTRLQQDLGYGSSSTPAIGNSISTQV